MADDDARKPNGAAGVEILVEDTQHLTLCSVFNRMIGDVFAGDSSLPLLQRITSSLSVNVPLLPEASKNSGKDALSWARRGSPLRSLLVVSVGTVVLLALSGILIFTLFFLAATFNAIIISLIVSLAAAGGFLALFFTFVAAIYVCALSVAGFVISTATISAIVASLIVAGWVGFFFTLWLVAQKAFHLAKRSVAVTGSAVSAYSTAWQAPQHSSSSISSKKSD